jgi:hypothetical protein
MVNYHSSSSEIGEAREHTATSRSSLLDLYYMFSACDDSLVNASLYLKEFPQGFHTLLASSRSFHCLIV